MTSAQVWRRLLPHARRRGLHVSKLGVKLRYEAIVFDKDGVLVDTEPYYDQRRRAFFAEVGIDDSAFPSFYGSNNEVIWKTVVPNDPVRRRALYQQFRLKFANAPVPYARLCVPGMREVLHACRGLGLRMGLASASPCWVVGDFLSQLQLTDFFDVALSGEECPANKPAPDIYLKAMRRLGVSPAKTLVVEDSPLGIRAAHKAGATVCAVTPPSAPHLDQSLADVQLGELRALLDWLSKCL